MGDIETEPCVYGEEPITVGAGSPMTLEWRGVDAVAPENGGRRLRKSGNRAVWSVAFNGSPIPLAPGTPLKMSLAFEVGNADGMHSHTLSVETNSQGKQVKFEIDGGTTPFVGRGGLFTYNARKKTYTGKDPMSAIKLLAAECTAVLRASTESGVAWGLMRRNELKIDFGPSRTPRKRKRRPAIPRRRAHSTRKPVKPER